VTWTPVDTNIATVTSTGSLSGVDVGITTLTAAKDSITSNTVNVDVCSSLASTCIDVFDTVSGKLFTNSPSVAYLDSLAVVFSNAGTYADGGLFGPAGFFYLFDWNHANALCGIYNAQSLGGRTNWELPEASELVDLHVDIGNMFDARGWPAGNFYWSATAGLFGPLSVRLNDGFASVLGDGPTVGTMYVSCVSDP
jgi:hypothetical protein